MLAGKGVYRLPRTSRSGLCQPGQQCPPRRSKPPSYPIIDQSACKRFISASLNPVTRRREGLASLAAKDARFDYNQDRLIDLPANSSRSFADAIGSLVPSFARTFCPPARIRGRKLAAVPRPACQWDVRGDRPADDLERKREHQVEDPAARSRLVEPGDLGR